MSKTKRKTMSFLRDAAERGYPEEYLIARIRGRRREMLKEWSEKDAVRGSADEGSRERYLRELIWIYYQMDPLTRRIFSPYFMYEESSTLLACLRYHRKQGNTKKRQAILSQSLISEEMKAALIADGDFRMVLDTIQHAEFLADTVPTLRDMFISEGPVAVERKIVTSLLEYATNLQTHPAIQRFFTLLTDYTNIIALYKNMLWKGEVQTGFIIGGNVSEQTLMRVKHSDDVSGVIALARLQGRTASPAEGADNIVTILEQAIMKEVRGMEQEYPDVGLILHYLWRYRTEERNLSIIASAKRVDRNRVEGELVH